MSSFEDMSPSEKLIYDFINLLNKEPSLFSHLYLSELQDLVNSLPNNSSTEKISNKLLEWCKKHNEIYNKLSIPKKATKSPPPKINIEDLNKKTLQAVIKKASDSINNN